MLAGGVESMSRAPFVMPKAESAFSRAQVVHDTTLGWRFVNPRMEARYGVDSMPETAQHVALEFGIERPAQDRMALRSQQRALAARQAGFFDAEISPVTLSQKKGEPLTVSRDEHPRARVLGMATAGVEPRLMGMGPAPATRKVLAGLGLQLSQMDVIELNEAFAAQGLAVLRNLGLADDDERVNPNGGAIALGHPLGASGARLVTTAMNQLQQMHGGRGGRYALCIMCIGVGQGIALVIERV